MNLSLINKRNLIMLKPKMVFTVLAVWFFFHIIIFWLMNPMSVEALIEGEKGQMSSRTLGYLSGSLCIMVGVIMVLLRDLDITRAKRVLLGIGISLVITDILIIMTNNAAASKFPNEQMLQTPLPALGIWIAITIYTLYVGVTAEE